MKRRDPKSADEWELAVNAAEYFLSIDAARQYGLITGGPVVNTDRAVELLERGRKLGYQPRPFGELVEMFGTGGFE
jgi:hypothetical protein